MGSVVSTTGHDKVELGFTDIVVKWLVLSNGGKINMVKNSIDLGPIYVVCF